MWQRDMDRSRKREETAGPARAAVQVVDPRPGGN